MMSMKRINWEDEIVVITGGSNGIGKMVVETLALRHVTVVVLDVEQPDFVQDWGRSKTFERLKLISDS
jgi:NAD(P)-dependent dehydrogenase (short-subunit alcohol dehydrogenase family)